jgi:hypothetical protein
MTTIRQRKAQDLAKQKAEEAARLAQEKSDLSLLGKDLGVVTEVKETGLFKIDDNAFDIGISQALINEIFQLKEIGSIGRAVEHPLGYAVPKLIEVQMAKPGEFAMSRDQVENDYLESKAKEEMEAEAKKLSEEAGRQGSLEKTANSMGLRIQTSQEFKFSESPAPEIGSNSAFNSAAFDLELGAVSDPIPISGRIAVLQVKSRSPFDESTFQKEKAEMRKRLLRSIQESYFQEYIRGVTDELEKAGKIRVNARALEQLELMY